MHVTAHDTLGGGGTIRLEYNLRFSRSLQVTLGIHYLFFFFSFLSQSTISILVGRTSEEWPAACWIFILDATCMFHIKRLTLDTGGRETPPPGSVNFNMNIFVRVVPQGVRSQIWMDSDISKPKNFTRTLAPVRYTQ